MILGNKISLVFFFFLILPNFSKSEEKITTSPLFNIEKIKPSFEELDEKIEGDASEKRLKEKKKFQNLKSFQAILIGLDKITAKSSEIIVDLKQSKKVAI